MTRSIIPDDAIVDNSKSCVVSGAFCPPAFLKPSAVDKLARLNEQLLISTAIVEERVDFGYWINLPKSWWVNNFGSGYREVQSNAESVGMLEVQSSESSSKRYSAGNYCAGYRLTQDYRDGCHLIWELSRKPRTEACSFRLATDAGRYLATKLPEFEVRSDYAIHTWDAITAALINRRKHRAVECEYGRFHSLITGASRKLRSTLTVGCLGSNNVTHNGIGLVGIDVANCQPLLLCALLPSGPNVHSDFQAWSDICHDGSLYEQLLWFVRTQVAPAVVKVKKKARTIDLVVDPSDWGRKEAKKNFMVVMFGKHPDVEQNPIWKAIEAMYPMVALAIREIKEGQYQRLAHKLQRLESKTIIQGVCGDLMRQFASVPVATVHDCVNVPAEYRDLTCQLLLKHFGAIGLVPKLTQD